MKTRMQPIGNIWSSLPRLVCDLASDLGKKSELVMLGADTELDSQELERIKDPLTYMVRNSADHGLEAPEGREAAGKLEQGRVRLNAYYMGGHIVIEVGDDERGLLVDCIEAKIVTNGLAPEAELALICDEQVSAYIVKAGSFTAAAITSVFWRGVRMNVVKRNVERISGTIDVTNERGKRAGARSSVVRIQRGNLPPTIRPAGRARQRACAERDELGVTDAKREARA